MKTNFLKIVITTSKVKHLESENFFLKKACFENGFYFKGENYNEVFVYGAKSISERDLTCINAFPSSFFQYTTNWNIVYDLDCNELFYPYPMLKNSERIPSELFPIFREITNNNNI